MISKPKAPELIDHLRAIRKQTCYDTLRGVIRAIAIMFGLGLVFGALNEFSDLCMSAGPQADGQTLWERNGNHVLTIGGYLVGIAVVEAGRQAALLLVDIADTLVLCHRESRAVMEESTDA